MEEMDTILIIGHGDPRDKGGSAAEKHAEKLSRVLGSRVRCAFLHAGPGVEEVLKDIATNGTDRIIVLPFFMSPGMYSERIVPGMFGLAEGQKSGRCDLDGRTVDVVVAPPFGADPSITDAVCGLVERSTRPGRSTAVVMIGHGSRDGSSGRNIGRIADGVRSRGYRVFTGSNEMEHPDVEEALQQAVESMAETIVVIPMFTSGGHHSRVEIPEKLGIPEGGSERRIQYMDGISTVVYTHEIGLEDGIADILAAQCRELGAQ